jgi:hypothetical protein
MVMHPGIALAEEATEREFAARIADDRPRALYDYWRSRRQGRRCPSRADIEPTDIPHLLPYLMLTEVVDGGARYRWRLVGTEVERHFGCPMTGRYIDEQLRGEYLAYVETLYRSAVAGCTPVYSENSYNTRGRGWDAYSEVFRTARVMLPLAPDGESVNMVLVCQVFFTNSGRAQHTVLVTQDRFEASL